MLFIMLKREKLCFNKKNECKTYAILHSIAYVIVLFLHVIETT
jgi:hypothetical protein